MRALLDRRPLLDVSVRRFTPAIPHALEAIVARCLAVSPADRYPDARALEVDLDRFLNRRPLVHAINPSRPERMRNWTIRHRWRLAAIAPWLILLGAWLTREAIDRRKPPIETVPEFLARVKKVEGGWYTQSIIPLVEFRDEYRRAWLPKLYLSFCLARGKSGDDADQLFREVMADKDAPNKLIAWGKEHPKFAGLLDGFSEDMFKYTDFQIEQKPDLREDGWAAIRKPYYERAKQALQIALKLDPTSPNILQNLALAEENFGNYREAYQQLSQSIELISFDRDAAHQADKKNAKVRFAACMHRCRVTKALAVHHRAQGSWDAAEQALNLLRQAETDVEYLDWFLKAISNTEKEQFYVEGIKLMVMLTLSETELDLGLLAEARKHLEAANVAIEKYAKLAEGQDLNVLQTMDSKWRRPLNAAWSRLHAKGAVGAAAGAGPKWLAGQPAGALLAATASKSN
jgi:tetratricopeptide (TPR) repeat protein